MGQKKIRKILKDNLKKLYEKGYGHPKDKNAHNATPYIHSDKTYKTYRSQTDHFCDWVYEKGVVYDVDEAFKWIPKYLQKLVDEGKSAWTVSTAMSALAKAYNCRTTELGFEAPKRKRQDIKRSRYEVEMDKHFSIKKNANLITFGKTTGLRREGLTKVHGNQLSVDHKGNLIIRNIVEKGGKKRDVLLIGSPKEIETVKEMMLAAGDGLVFPKVHTKFDEHYYRGVYACKAYKKFARPLESLDRHEKYYCRKDMKGFVLDKEAMEKVSVLLGHERRDVVLNYLYSLYN